MALIGPGGQLGWLAALAQALRAIQQVETAQVVIIQAGAGITSAQFAGQLPEAATVQAWQQNRALGVFHKAAAFQSNRRAFAGANAENQQLDFLLFEGQANAVLFLRVKAAVDQQYFARALGALFE